MGGNFIWSFPRFNFKAFFVQHFLYDLFFIMNNTDFASYVDNNSSHAIGMI